MGQKRGEEGVECFSVRAREIRKERGREAEKKTALRGASEPAAI